jgi:cytochrome c oxidase subunit 3
MDSRFAPELVIGPAEGQTRWARSGMTAAHTDCTSTETEMADAHAKPKHDYHLVDPSPWPAVGSVSAFIVAVGAIAWMHNMFSAAPLVFAAGVLGVLYTMVGWWRDVVREAQFEGYHTRVVQLSHRYGMILFIASEVMFFVAWFWAYFNTALFPGDVHQVLRGELIGNVWPPVPDQAGHFRGTFDPWHLPLLNTLILLTSGTTVTWAHHSLLHGNRRGLINGLWLTILLGLSFTAVQAYEYANAGFTFSGHIYGSTFFMATGFHGAHVIIGTIFLTVCLIRAYAGHFSPTQHLGFEFAAWYWHFVDVVWLFLFASIYVWGGGTPLAH